MSYAVIGGSGLYKFDGLQVVEQKKVATPYGEPSDVITVGNYNGETVYFLPRHGASHHLPPHKINYRANLWALKHVGAIQVIAVNAVGGIATSLKAGDIVIPDQLIDYTWGREHTYSDGSSLALNPGKVDHIDFTEPFDELLRQRIVRGARRIPMPVVERGVYGCTQGPRLESAAEIRTMSQEGCTIVGMTAMPEAALAREIGLAYASISIVANMAAGLSPVPLSADDIYKVVADGLTRIQQLVKMTIAG